MQTMKNHGTQFWLPGIRTPLIVLGTLLSFSIPGEIHAQCQSTPAICAQITKLADPLDGLQAIDALHRIGEPAVPDLVAALKNPSPLIRLHAARVLWRIDPKAERKLVIKQLSQVIRGDTSDHVRAGAANALGNLWADAADSLDDLASAVEKDTYYGVRYNAAWALGQIVPAIHGEQGWSERLDRAMTALTNALTDQNDSVRENAASGLGEIGWRAHSGLGRLRDLSAKDSSGSVRKAAAKARAAIYRDIALFLAPPLILAFLLSALICLLVLYWRWPLMLLRINDALAPFTDFKLPEKWFGGRTIPVRYLLLVGFFNYRLRVLDAWVAARIGKARKRFEGVPLSPLTNGIPAKVKVDSQLESIVFDGAQAARLIKSGISKDRWCVLVIGDVGTGKTHLAYRMAGWAMEQAVSTRLHQHLMLPVLIERDLNQELPKGTRLIQTVRGLLQEALGESNEIPEELTRQLLRRQRILVIVDNISMMSKASLEEISPQAADWGINAMVAVSRTESNLAAVNRILIRTQGIRRADVPDALEEYLNGRRKHELFRPTELKAAAARLQTLGDEQRDVSILILSLFVEHLIAGKERGDRAVETQVKSIPQLISDRTDMMIRHTVNDAAKTRRIRRDATVVAWECVRSRYVSGRGRLVSVVSGLGGDDCEQRIDYLRDPVGLIFYDGMGDQYVSFYQDAFAEYLAAMHIVDLCEQRASGVTGGERAAWHHLFFAKADELTQKGYRINSFLHAVQDCAEVQCTDPDIGRFVSVECAKRIAQLSEKDTTTPADESLVA